MLRTYRSIVLAGLLACAACGSSTEDTASAENAAEENTEEAAAPEQAPETPAATAATPAATDDEPHLTAGPKKDVYSVGDVAALDSLLIKVNSVTTAAETDFKEKPKAGHEYVVVNVTWENGTTKLRDFSTLMNTLMLDAQGKEIKVKAGASAEGAMQLDRSRGAGKSGTGPIFYEVPANAKGLKWVFRTLGGSALDMAEKGRVVFDLGR
ncbi:DUF4352 domain-containing protein [Hymenobacter sp. BT635]|uniref:DUF4352 domain-containing protein n=1 Tax=Hymenobacter nitidus TaxID=2880929 RepID=A0ABS8ABI1_9BACT|nr:DUF4352 domain-containing protein [Hymenobacter nitidus]MCB2376389.1 DUF4352 domain-containing protein [Hymenobacter nitidus]